MKLIACIEVIIIDVRTDNSSNSVHINYTKYIREIHLVTSRRINHIQTDLGQFLYHHLKRAEGSVTSWNQTTDQANHQDK